MVLPWVDWWEDTSASSFHWQQFVEVEQHVVFRFDGSTMDGWIAREGERMVQGNGEQTWRRRSVRRRSVSFWINFSCSLVEISKLFMMRIEKIACPSRVERWIWLRMMISSMWNRTKNSNLHWCSIAIERVDRANLTRQQPQQFHRFVQLFYEKNAKKFW